MMIYHKNLSLRLQEFPYKVGKYKLQNNSTSISAIQDMVKEKNRGIINVIFNYKRVKTN